MHTHDQSRILSLASVLIIPAMSTEIDLLHIATAIALVTRKKQKRKKSKWVKEWLKKRRTYSHTNLLTELRLEVDDYRNYLRMDENTYIQLLHLVTPLIEKQDTVMRQAISAHERLSTTLRFLATGRSFEDLKFSVIISPQALGKIIPEVCVALCQVLANDYMKVRIIINYSIRDILIIFSINYSFQQQKQNGYK